jgi:D-alanine-D-alanine ligase
VTALAAKLRIGVVFGGSSVEHEVSVISARGVLRGLEAGPFECFPIGVTEDGRWLPPELSEPIVHGDAARVEPPAKDPDGPRLCVDPGAGALIRAGGGRTRRLALDVVFPLIHGWGGEDGRIQGMLEIAGIPYVGSGVLGSAVAMDKETTKSIFERHGLPVGPWTAVRGEDYRREPDDTHARLAAEIGFPLFVKPANGGSSVGVSRVRDASGLPAAIAAALECDTKILVEKAIDAREIECAVLGNHAPEASVPGEILPSREFYDYAAKYTDGTSRLLIPAPLDPGTESAVREIALRAFRVLDLAGLARVDFLVERKTQRALLNEANTLPGFTPISMFPKLWEASGIPYPELLQRLVSLALDRWAAERRRATRRTD